MTSFALAPHLPCNFGPGTSASHRAGKTPLAFALATALSVHAISIAAQTAYRPPLSVPPTFYDLQGLSDSFNMQNSIMNAGISAAIKMNRARLAALNGQLRPQASYTPSPDVTLRAQQKLARNVSTAGDSTASLAEIRAGYDAYLADSRARNESPDNFVTACAYYVTTALEIEHNNHLTPQQQLAVRGDCVTVLAARQQGVGLFVNAADRQFASQSLATIAGVAATEYEHSGTAARATIRINLEKSFHQFFGSNLPEIPVDRLACVGANSAAALSQCSQLPNTRFEAIAHNTQ
jgi:hypothetical protein